MIESFITNEKLEDLIYGNFSHDGKFCIRSILASEHTIELSRIF